ncbi:hypothetical protein N177_0284 [Lutibaculum baratangense AMV1]|uniref:CBS domain-containing protein n=2 Tax=Lutibaculum TaxID=1358438 RepID=V4RWB0_9HYPH|nr:hypothetical protein N177_0284 [Lutibaculum baratangense AMV1]
MIKGAFWVIGLSGGALVLAVVVLALGGKLQDTNGQLALGYIDRFIGAIIPLFGAWVGAVIAFYFARDNFDAATENTRALLNQITPIDLEVVTAEETMTKRAQLTVVTAGDDEARLLKTEILPRFIERGLSRVIIVDTAGRGIGVLQDAAVMEFLVNPPPTLGKTQDQLTFKDLHDNDGIRKLLDVSAIYVRPEETLASARRKMEEQSRAAPRTVRDAFVTRTGDRSDPILGYLSDIDIARKGRFAG